MLACASNADLTQYQGVTSFSDVAVSAWYAPQVEWAYQQGLIKGRGEGLFCPESNITREEAVAIIDRYAVSEDSPVLDDNQYELDDNADEYLSDEEIGVLDALLADPAYDDETEIASWASEDVDAMSTAGIICGDEDNNFNPQDPIKRSECVKVISTYIINDTKPTFYFPGGSYIEYLDTGDDAVTTSSTEDTADSEEDVVDFNGYGDPPDLSALLSDSTDSGDITVSWAKKTHQNLTDYAIRKIRIDRPYITNKMESESLVYSYENKRHKINGAQAIWVYAYYADSIAEEKENDYEKHFYEPGVGSYTGSPDKNAFRSFNDHFYNAYTSYKNGDKTSSYREMGLSVHYLEDMNNPYHASGHTNNNTQGKHRDYEQWANNQLTYVSILNDNIYDSYRFMYDNDFIDLANSFAGSAKSQYTVCSNYDSNPTAARTATVGLLARTERAVAGLINRFYYYGWLNH